MGISYKKLWKLLIDKDLTPAALCKELNIPPPTFTRMKQGKGVELKILEKIVTHLGVDFGDIMERIPDEPPKS